MRILGHPNLVIISSNIKHIAIVELQSLTALALAHLVRYSVVAIIYLAHVRVPGGFICPTKSMAHFSNACRVICSAKGISSLRDGFPNLWHTSHALAYSLASLCNIGHQRPAHKTFYVVSFPT
jgi:hypothetical protein